jgi:hypothetical protein
MFGTGNHSSYFYHSKIMVQTAKKIFPFTQPKKLIKCLILVAKSVFSQILNF